MFVYLYVVALRALLGLNGSSPEAEAKGLPFGIVRGSITQSFISRAASLLGTARGKESRWQETSRMAAFGSLLRALRLRALLALSHTGLNHHAFAGCRVRVGVQQRVAVCRVLCRSLCNVVQCEVAVVCVVSVVYGR